MCTIEKTITKQDMINLKSPLTLTPNEREAISGFVKNLRQRFAPMIREIILFGSKVRGNSEKYSDIDILIVLDSMSWEIKKVISELAAQENIKHKVLITTIRYNVHTWESPVVKLSPFGKAVREEGIRL